MAELFGTIASGISVASFTIQVIDSIQKLKRLYSRMQSAPTDVLDLLEDLEVQGHMLKTIDQSFQEDIFLNPRVKVLAMQSQGIYRRSGEALMALALNMEQELGKGRKREKFKIALRYSEVEVLRQRLGDAKLNMATAYQIYCNAVQQQNWNMQQQDMAQMMTQISQVTGFMANMNVNRVSVEDIQVEDTRSRCITATPSDAEVPSLQDEGNIMVQKQVYRKPGRTDQKVTTILSGLLGVVTAQRGYFSETMLSINLPSWLRARRYNICFSKAYQGWDYSFRSYRVIPSDAPVFKYCMEGDVEALQRLFANGESCPFEVDPDGRTPLHVAALHAMPQACRFLLCHGADVDVRTSNVFCAGRSSPIIAPHSTPMHYLAHSSFSLKQNILQEPGQPSRTTESINEDFQNTMLQLLSHQKADLLAKNRFGCTIFDVFDGPPQVLGWLKGKEREHFQNLDFSGTCSIILYRMWAKALSPTYDDAGLMRVLLPPGHVSQLIREQVTKELDYEQQRFLGIVVTSWWLYQSSYYRVGLNSKYLDEIGELVIELIAINPTLFTACAGETFSLIENLKDIELASITDSQKMFKKTMMMFTKGGADPIECVRMETERHGKPWIIQTEQQGQDPNDYTLELLEMRVGAMPSDNYLVFEDLYVSNNLLIPFWIICGESESEYDWFFKKSPSTPGAWPEAQNSD